MKTVLVTMGCLIMAVGFIWLWVAAAPPQMIRSSGAASYSSDAGLSLTTNALVGFYSDSAFYILAEYTDGGYYSFSCPSSRKLSYRARKSLLEVKCE